MISSDMRSFHGVGLGLRREMLSTITTSNVDIDFLEIAPENWLPFGGKLQTQLAALNEQYQFVCHGLSLSIGSPDPLDIDFVKQLKAFFKKYDIKVYSEHLSYCSGLGHLYDLMPIPFTQEAVSYVAKRILQVQDILEQPLILENVSYYASPSNELSEADFINAVLDEANCQLLLDVNNIYVNSVNHAYDAMAFLKQMPKERIAYYHIAGHYKEADDLLIDTHGAQVVEPVWQLLEQAYQVHGVKPTLLERDFNIPTLSQLQRELNKIKQAQQLALSSASYISAIKERA